MSLHPLRPQGYAWGSLAGLGALALALIGGVARALFGSGHEALPRQLMDACMLFFDEAGGSVWAFVAARPLSALAVGLVASSFGWAALRLMASLLANYRVARRFSRVAPGQVPELDRALARVPRVPRGRLRILPADAVQAFTLGIWRPRVCLATGLIECLSEEELVAVLLHEAAHFRARDPLRLAAARFLADALWFIPLARTLGTIFARMAELQADQATLAAGGEAVELASAIVKTAQGRVGPRLAMAPALEGPSFLEERVERLLGVRREVRVDLSWRRGLASGSVIVALLAVLFGASGASGPSAKPTGMTAARPMMAMPMMPGCPVMCGRHESRGRLF